MAAIEPTLVIGMFLARPGTRVTSPTITKSSPGPIACPSLLAGAANEHHQLEEFIRDPHAPTPLLPFARTHLAPGKADRWLAESQPLKGQGPACEGLARDPRS